MWHHDYNDYHAEAECNEQWQHPFVVSSVPHIDNTDNTAASLSTLSTQPRIIQYNTVRYNMIREINVCSKAWLQRGLICHRELKTQKACWKETETTTKLLGRNGPVTSLCRQSSQILTSPNHIMAHKAPFISRQSTDHITTRWFSAVGISFIRCFDWHYSSASAGVMPNMSHCQITHNTRFARHVGIIKPNPNPSTNPSTNPNPKTVTLTLNLTVTKEINIK